MSTEFENRLDPINWSGLDLSNSYRDNFSRKEILVMSNFLTSEGLRALRDDAEVVQAHARRRDVQIAESANTWRKMSTVGGKIVSKFSSMIPAIYNDVRLLDLLSYIADESVMPVPDQNENHVINILHRDDDLHGGHVDTYAYALNLVLHAPRPDCGGEVVVAFGESDPESLLSTKVKKISLNAADAYFLKTDTNVHGVRPIKHGNSRLVVNMAYANRETLHLESYSTTQLY